jgi:hypothetical protein
MILIWSYAAYLTVSLGVTAWVARTLFKNGAVFLEDAFHGNVKLADSINHLLVVGFYLINAGYVTLALKYGLKPISAPAAVEFVSTKIGGVLLILGGMHFFNLLVLSKARKMGLGARNPAPPTDDQPEEAEEGPIALGDPA